MKMLAVPVVYHLSLTPLFPHKVLGIFFSPLFSISADPNIAACDIKQPWSNVMENSLACTV